MARENVVLIQRLYDHFANRDIPAIFAAFAPDAVILQSSELPWGGVFEGTAGLQDFFSRLLAHLQSKVTVEQIIDAGDHVVATGRTRGTTVKTGKAFDVPFAHVWELKDRKVVRVRFFIDNPSIRPAL
jgi:ketosteroid isomerase-like protein